MTCHFHHEAVLCLSNRRKSNPIFYEVGPETRSKIAKRFIISMNWIRVHSTLAHLQVTDLGQND